MAWILEILPVGPWPMNCYLVTCELTQHCAVIDPGADALTILDAVGGRQIDRILVTHGHGDHVGALLELREMTGAPVCMHPLDAEHFNLEFDVPLADGERLHVGEGSLLAIHTPGHTPGQTCFDLGDGRILVGDTLFTGGPGKTWSAQDFTTTMNTLQNIVFQWPDETRFFPGHGPGGLIGKERPAFEAFAARGWPADLFGDVAWG